MQIFNYPTLKLAAEGVTSHSTLPSCQPNERRSAETLRVSTLNGPRESVWASRRAMLRSGKESASRRIAPFHQQIQLPRKPKSQREFEVKKRLPPQTGFEPPILRLTVMHPWNGRIEPCSKDFAV